MIGRTLWNDDWSFVKTAVDTKWEDVFPENGGKNEILWQPVDLPHDWLIYNTLDLYENSIGWYRKKFILENTWDIQDGEEFRRTILRFDGVYMDSTLYVNGERAGDWKYGYSAFEWDITDYLREGSNEVIMKVVHQAPNSRWYSGAGIYRNVWLVQMPEIHIPLDGVYVSTEERKNGYEMLLDTEICWGAAVKCEEGDSGSAKCRTEQYAEGDCTETNYNIVYRLLHEGELVFHVEKSLDPGQEKDSTSVFVENPRRWDIEEPNLYDLEIMLVKVLVENGFDRHVIMQKETIRVGFRTISFLPEQGFLLNGRKVRLNGTCDHHDLGALGAAFHVTAMKRKLLKMRSMGVNAVRTSHNMPAKEMMDLADEMGFLVLSEAFDMWEIAKNPYDYARFFKEWAEKDVRSWIRRDRNHPSVIMWSIGNEIPDTHVSEYGQEITRRLADYVRMWDYRNNAPVTIGSNYMPWENAKKCADIIKMAGYNYAEKYYEEHHKEHPDWVIYGSETGSVVQSRGIYHFPLERAALIEEDEQCSALGNSTASWAARNAEYCIVMDRETPFSCGQFIWTAFDYIGEPTPYQTKNSYFGQIDTAGFPKDSFYLYQAEWTDYHEKPMVHVYPYWDFNAGQLIDIRVCSNAPLVELFVNGRSMGRCGIDHTKGMELQPHWKVPYEPGFIEAVAYNENGMEIARKTRHSFGDSYRITAKADKEILRADGEDLIFIEIGTKDQQGYDVENASDYVRVKVEGPARLMGLDNGDSTDYDQYKGTVRKLFNGRLLAIVAAKYGQTGEAVIRIEDARAGSAKAEDAGKESAALLLPAEITIQAVPAPLRPGVSARMENEEMPLSFVNPGFVPVRKIELTAEGQTLTREHSQVLVRAEILPGDAADRELIWKVTDLSGLECRSARIETLSDGNSARITGISDGSFQVRCMSRNGTDKVKLISRLDMRVEGMGQAFVNPYKPVAGMSYGRSRGNVGRGPQDSACTDKEAETELTYTNLDFGDYGSDEVTLSIFTNDSDARSLQIWQGIPGEEDSELLGDIIYQKPGEWEVFQPETYLLSRRIQGIASVTVKACDKLFLKELHFTRREKAFERLNTAQTAVIYGDSYKKLEDRVENIGNNVSFVYKDMDFGKRGARRITICGRTPLEHNTIQIRFSGKNESTQVLEFPYSEEYICPAFDLEPVFGMNEVTFIFLPGCQFDFAWFLFE